MQNSARSRSSGGSGESFNRQSLFGGPTCKSRQGYIDYRVDMGVCSYYQRGACKFGDNCKNEHPGSARDGNRGGGGGGFGGGSNNNRFGAFNGDRYRPAQNNNSTAFGGNRDAKPASFHLDRDDIKNDLTSQRPVYPLSCYGPGREAPRQLIEGPVEISPEELRLRYYTLRAEGNEPTAQQEEGALNEKMQQQVKAIMDDIPGAMRYIEEGANIHPNRIDIAKGDASATATAPANSSNASTTATNPFMKAPANPFQAASSTQPSAFGQASTPGFGKPAFGQPSNPTQTTSAFGQASNPGQTSAFGQASNPGQTTPAFGQASNPAQAASPFGAASALGQKPSPFGQPSALGGGGTPGSAFGKPAFGASGFGQPSMPSAGSAFGQTSSAGQASAFGQPSAPGAASGFGQANALGQKPSPFSKPGFGQSGFGQPSQPGANASPFGQAAQSGTAASPFGQAAQSGTSPFGQQAASGQSPFGQQAQQPTQPSSFGQQAQQAPKPNPFQQAQSQQSDPAANPFGGAAASQTPAFGQASKPSPFGQPQTQTPTSSAPNPFLKTASTGAPTSTPAFGQPSQPAAAQQAPQQAPTADAAPAAQPHVAGVTPDGKPIDAKDRYKEGKPEEYEGEKGKLLEEIYKRVAQMGRFNDDEEIPITPPKCEWIVPLAM